MVKEIEGWHRGDWTAIRLEILFSTFPHLLFCQPVPLLLPPFAHCAVLGWRPFKATHGTIMSQRGHLGWGKLPYSTIITVYRLLWFKMYTRRPVLVATLPLHPTSGQSRVPIVLGKEILYIYGYTVGGIPLRSQYNNVMCMVVGHKQTRRQVCPTV